MFVELRWLLRGWFPRVGGQRHQTEESGDGIQDSSGQDRSLLTNRLPHSPGEHINVAVFSIEIPEECPRLVLGPWLVGRGSWTPVQSFVICGMTVGGRWTQQSLEPSSTGLAQVSK